MAGTRVRMQRYTDHDMGWVVAATFAAGLIAGVVSYSLWPQDQAGAARRSCLLIAGAVALVFMTGALLGCFLQGRERIRIARRLEYERLEAIAANRTKSSFLAYTSHELRTPLNAIIGFSEFLMMEYAGPLVERQKQYLADIRSSGLHLQGLIGDILDLTKAEAGKITLVEQPVDIQQLAQICLKLVEGQAKEAGVQLLLGIVPSLPFLMADELRCKQVIINLAINAIQFTPSGGVVRIEARQGPGGEVVLTVSDTGKGIPKADIPKAIEPYFRSGIGEPSHNGYGLGLPLARRIVELHGGTFGIASEPGNGTVVTATFPAIRSVAHDIVQPALPQPTPPQDVVLIRPPQSKRQGSAA